MNPYTAKNFFQFFPLFFKRLLLLLSGQLSSLATDEIQILVLALISIAAALIGSLLVLKKMAMVANSLSHTMLVGIVIAYLILQTAVGSDIQIQMPILLLAAALTGVLTTGLTQLLHQVIRLQEDASIGLVFTALFALGILLVTIYTRNAHIGLEVVMGNADALQWEDVKLAGWVALSNIVIITLFYKEWKLISFDSQLASSLGFKPNLFNYLLMLLTSATAIGAFRAVGALLFLSFLVGLPLTARQLTHRLSRMLLYGAGLGILCSLVSVALSRHMLSVYNMPLSTAGIASCMVGIFFLISLCFRKR